MLTVKWTVQTDKGSVERIFEADDVAIAYRNNPDGTSREDGSDFRVGRYAVKKAALVINPHDMSSDRCLVDGHVYVMNGVGKTVGNYQLDDKVIEYAALSGFLPTPGPIVDPGLAVAA